MSANILLYQIAEATEQITGCELNNARIQSTGRRNQRETETLRLFLRCAYDTQRFTLVELARAVHVGHATVIHHLREREPDRKTLEKIQSVLLRIQNEQQK